MCEITEAVVKKSVSVDKIGVAHLDLGKFEAGE